MLPLVVYRKLYPSLREHRLVEDRLFSLLAAVLPARYRTAPPGRVNPLRYAQKHFFSILFLAIYRALGLPADRRLFYGQINHCLRGIVTGADNLLDDEYKEMLPLAFPPDAVRFKSVMHILLFDRFLDRLCLALPQGVDPALGVPLRDGLFQAIVPIGAEEATEEGGVHTVLTPEEILDSVHLYKGGRLLCLAFVAPRLLENGEVAGRLARAEAGVYAIGLALQVIDDLTDFHQDLAAANHNYLVSAIHHQGDASERAFLAAARQGDTATGVEEGCPATLSRVMAAAIGEAMAGFRELESAGFWLDQERALALVKNLFVLRGVERLLPFFPERIDPRVRLQAAGENHG